MFLNSQLKMYSESPANPRHLGHHSPTLSFSWRGDKGKKFKKPPCRGSIMRLKWDLKQKKSMYWEGSAVAMAKQNWLHVSCVNSHPQIVLLGTPKSSEARRWLHLVSCSPFYLQFSLLHEQLSQGNTFWVSLNLGGIQSQTQGKHNNGTHLSELFLSFSNIRPAKHMAQSQGCRLRDIFALPLLLI